MQASKDRLLTSTYLVWLLISLVTNDNYYEGILLGVYVFISPDQRLKSFRNRYEQLA